MPYKYKGGIPLAVGYDMNSNRPLDERQIVLTQSDLTSVPNCFAGIQIQVEDEDFALYRWNGINQSDLGNWTNVDELGGGGTGDGDMLKSTYDSNNNGVVDDSERLGNQLPAFYLDQTDLASLGNMRKEVYDTNANNIVDNSEQLGGQSPGYYDQNAHVADTQVHLSTDERAALTNSPNAPTGVNTIATQADISAAGGGDMLKSVYDTNGSNVVDDSEKLDGQLPSVYDQSAHAADVTTNPHAVNKTQVGLGNVDNTSDALKPISNATQSALDGKVEEAPSDGTPYARQDAGWVATQTNLYDGIDTTAVILALNPSLYLGQTWFASDTKYIYQASTSTTQGIDVWQGIWNIYDETTDTFTLSPTQDGQTQNIGQEIFFKAFNTGTVIGTELAPKVYKAVGSYAGDTNFKEVTEASSGDISTNSVFGFNTTPANLNDYTKIITWGDLKGVDTSGWAVNTVLYLSTTPGDVTTVKPSINAFPIALVTKQHLTDGQLFINTAGVAREDIATVPVELSKVNFTADVTTPVATQFYEAIRDAEGIIGTATQIKTVTDDQTLPLDQDWLSVASTIDSTIRVSSYTGQIEFEIDDTGSQEKLFLEVYLADANGDVLDSGSGLPNGTLLQPPILVLETGLLNSNTGSTLYGQLTGYVQTPVDVLVGQRIRYRVLVSKVGTQGGNKIFTVYSGTDHDTYFNVPKRIEAKDVLYNNVDSNLTANNVKTALDELDSVKAGLADPNVFENDGNIFKDRLRIQDTTDSNKDLFTFNKFNGISAYTVLDRGEFHAGTLNAGDIWKFDGNGGWALVLDTTGRKWTMPETNISDINAVGNEKGLVNREWAVGSYDEGEPTGSDKVVNIVSLTQAEYNAGPINATTLYNITDA